MGRSNVWVIRLCLLAIFAVIAPVEAVWARLTQLTPDGVSDPVYLDQESISRKGAMYSAWFNRNYSEVQKDEHGRSFRSSRMQMVIDCAAGAGRVVRLELFSGPSASGAHVGSLGNPGDVMEVVSSSASPKFMAVSALCFSMRYSSIDRNWMPILDRPERKISLDQRSIRFRDGWGEFAILVDAARTAGQGAGASLGSYIEVQFGCGEQRLRKTRFVQFDGVGMAGGIAALVTYPDAPLSSFDESGVFGVVAQSLCQRQE